MYETSYTHFDDNNSSRKCTIGPWDCRNVSGRKLACGAYPAVLKLTNQDGSIELLKTTFGIKDN